MAREYDIIIAGAGPAGLSLASVLSQENRVCVIEKGKIGSTTKSWASARDLMKKLGLSHCIENNKIDFLEFKHYLGANWLFRDVYCQLSEEKLLKEFVKRCKKRTYPLLKRQNLQGSQGKKER